MGGSNTKQATIFYTFFLKAQVGTSLQHDLKACYAITPIKETLSFRRGISYLKEYNKSLFFLHISHYVIFMCIIFMHIIFKAPNLQTFIYMTNPKLQADLKMTACYPNKQIQQQDQHISCNS